MFGTSQVSQACIAHHALNPGAEPHWFVDREPDTVDLIERALPLPIYTLHEPLYGALSLGEVGELVRWCDAPESGYHELSPTVSGVAIIA